MFDHFGDCMDGAMVSMGIVRSQSLACEEGLLGLKIHYLVFGPDNDKHCIYHHFCFFYLEIVLKNATLLIISLRKINFTCLIELI